ncbi:hypothetical protein D3C76_1565560 [compost metagenome]
MLGILVDADGVGILHAARQDHGIVLLDTGRAECPVNLEVIRGFIVVPTFDLTFFRRKYVDLCTRLLQRFFRPGQFDLLETIGHQYRDALAIQGIGHEKAPDLRE